MDGRQYHDTIPVVSVAGAELGPNLARAPTEPPRCPTCCSIDLDRLGEGCNGPEDFRLPYLFFFFYHMI